LGFHVVNRITLPAAAAFFMRAAIALRASSLRCSGVSPAHRFLAADFTTEGSSSDEEVPNILW